MVVVVVTVVSERGATDAEVKRMLMRTFDSEKKSSLAHYCHYLSRLNGKQRALDSV